MKTHFSLRRAQRNPIPKLEGRSNALSYRKALVAAVSLDGVIDSRNGKLPPQTRHSASSSAPTLLASVREREERELERFKRPPLLAISRSFWLKVPEKEKSRRRLRLWRNKFFARTKSRKSVKQHSVNSGNHVRLYITVSSEIIDSRK